MYRETYPTTHCAEYFCFHEVSFLEIEFLSVITTLIIICDIILQATIDINYNIVVIASTIMIIPWIFLFFEDIVTYSILWLNIDILGRKVYHPLARDLTGETLEPGFF